MRYQNDDFISILLFRNRVSSGAEPFFHRINGPSNLIGAGSSLHQKNLVIVPCRGDDQVTVESPESGDIGVHVIDQTHFEDRVWS